MDQNCYSTYTCDEVQELKLLQLRVAPNSEFSEIATRLKTNKIRRKQIKIFQNWYSTELIIGALRKSKKETIRN